MATTTAAAGPQRLEAQLMEIVTAWNVINYNLSSVSKQHDPDLSMGSFLMEITQLCSSNAY